MMSDDCSAHLVHGPGNDAVLLCLQLVRRNLISGSKVLWAGILPQKPAESILGSLSEASLSNLLIVPIKKIEISSGILKSADLVIVWSWCTNHGRASKTDISLLEGIMKSARGRVVATSLGNQDASGGPGIIARSRVKLENMGFNTWFFTRKEDGQERMLKSSDSEMTLKREDGEFKVLPEF